MEPGRPLFIPAILGTTRQGRMSAYAAKLVTGELAKRKGIETELIDIAKLPLPVTPECGKGHSRHAAGRKVLGGYGSRLLLRWGS
jgi:NAD(P)H-dependent FMN reductase